MNSITQDAGDDYHVKRSEMLVRKFELNPCLGVVLALFDCYKKPLQNGHDSAFYDYFAECEIGVK